MRQGSRSPFGELVHHHRRRLGLSRKAVEDRTYRLAGLIETTVSERTIARIEQRSSSGDWHLPSMHTVKALAAVFELAPGTRDYDTFISAALTPAAVLGQRRPVPASSLVGLQVDADRFKAPRFYPAGREEHLARITTAIDAAVAGRPGVLFVGAPAGVGKTSLITAACHSALERHQRLAVLWTAVLDREVASVPWEPFRTMLALMVGDLEVASERELLTFRNTAELVRRIPVAVRALAAESAGLLNWLLPAGTLANPRLESMFDADVRRRLDAAVRQQREAPWSDNPPSHALERMLVRYAGAGPVVLVLEDLHWADDATVAVLKRLLTRLAGRRLPVVVIGSWRPGDVAGDGGDAHPLARVMRQALRHFPGARTDLSTAVGGMHGRSFVDAVVAQLALPDPVPVAEELFHRTAGVPLVVVTLLRLLEPEGITPEAIRALSLPEEIAAIFAEPLNRVDPDTRELLRAGSVQGTSFWAEPVMHMLGIDRDRFIELVDSRLVRLFGMLDRRGVDHIGSRGLHRYEFSHALLHDYLIESMSELERERWHERTATALVDLLGERDHAATDRIAVHLERAGLRQCAAVAWIHAGIHALDHREFDRARSAYERVLTLDVRATDPATHLQALVGIGNCHTGQGDLPGARRVLGDVLDRATRANLLVTQGHALESLAEIDFAAGDIQAGVDRLMTVFDIWTRTEQDEAARAMANLGYLLYGMGRYEEAMLFARQGGERAERIGDTRTWISARIAYANCLMDLGRYDEAVTIYEDCIPECQAIGDAHREDLCRINIALAALERGDWDTCETLSRRVLARKPRPSALLISTGEYDLAYVAEARGDHDAAEERYTRCCGIRETNGHWALLIDALAGLLRVPVARGDLERARELRADIVGRIAARGLDGIEHVGRMYLALMAASEALGEPDRAERFLRDAVEYLRERAGRLSDPAMRESYLTSPPAHRQIMALTAERGIR